MKASIRAALAITIAAATPALAQVPPAQLAKPAAPPPVNIPGVSAAGNATLTRLQGQRDPVLQQLAQQQQGVARQILTAIAGANVDVDKFAGLLKQSEGLNAQMRVRADDHVLQALRALPPADRAPFLRGVVGAGQKR
ncbi:hypothetical protein FHS31_001985 [Sphingomonas vulcanisoli]|uniref:Periplasmic heavy metal sensor n=1 Tax=Sphingomonas vulcanisoli TaxID=1658060 RepID=A0ABX0TS74_9SPHN|nr:hypothetical protein [Sphingomonas vulcanisoli]NIJ08368.1 hypothetical protein [Sphingomonas vulcanisoli]